MDGLPIDDGSPGAFPLFLDSISNDVFAALRMAPLERIKMLLQTQNADARTKYKFLGPIHCFQRIKLEEGLKSLWRGNLAGIAQSILYQIGYVFIDNPEKSYLDPSEARSFSNIFSVVLSRTATALIMTGLLYPLEVSRLRVGVDYGNKSERQFHGHRDCLQKIYRAEGVPGLYKGFSFRYAGILMREPIYFSSSFFYKGYIFPEESPLSYVYSSLMAVLTTELLTYPLECLKAKLMVQAGNPTPMYKGFFNTLLNVRKYEGLRGYYAGFSMQLFFILIPEVTIGFFSGRGVNIQWVL